MSFSPRWALATLIALFAVTLPALASAAPFEIVCSDPADDVNRPDVDIIELSSEPVQADVRLTMRVAGDIRSDLDHYYTFYAGGGGPYSPDATVSFNNGVAILTHGDSTEVLDATVTGDSLSVTFSKSTIRNPDPMEVWGNALYTAVGATGLVTEDDMAGPGYSDCGENPDTGDVLTPGSTTPLFPLAILLVVAVVAVILVLLAVWFLVLKRRQAETPPQYAPPPPPVAGPPPQHPPQEPYPPPQWPPENPPPAP